MRSAPAFQSVTIPCNVIAMIASSEYSTMAANLRRSASRARRSLISPCNASTLSASSFVRSVAFFSRSSLSLRIGIQARYFSFICFVRRCVANTATPVATKIVTKTNEVEERQLIGIKGEIRNPEAIPSLTPVDLFFIAHISQLARSKGNTAIPKFKVITPVRHVRQSLQPQTGLLATMFLLCATQWRGQVKQRVKLLKSYPEGNSYSFKYH